MQVIGTLVAALVAIFTILPGALETLPNLTRWWQERFPPIPPARAGETLIVIAPYQSPAGIDRSAIHKEIMRTLRAEHEALRREVNAPTLNLRIAEAPQALNVDDQSAAEALGRRVGATLVIWGEVSDVRVTTNILNLRQPEEVIINLSETERTPLANPQAFTRYVTSDLPGIAVYISFSILGDAYYSAKEYPTATRLLERAVARLPEDAPLADVAQTFFRLGWLYQVSDNNPAQAIAAYDRALELDPKNAIACYNRGLARRAQGDLTQAIADYTCAIELNSEYVSAYLSRGSARRAQGDLAGALADYKHALKLDPRSANAYIGRGLTYYDQGNLTQAIYDYTAAISFDPKNVIAYNNRGLARRAQGDVAGAIVDYNRAIELDPEYAHAYNNRGYARYKQGDLAGAIADYDRAIELDPNYVNAYMNRGAARRDQGDRQGALADFEHARALTRDPQDQKWLDEQIANLK
ncbi:MAG: tetratricopeptide repeat protein [Roseiflexus sp.]|nr:tetratricopeptide repeat protein [Roseiflexus sp.]MCS7288900.1 tetratricopeptide repeat protein [Roseiflexus sp.]MDW8146836.1 tetratricopeptide repeat protein [Roseiflexaceae bacterium]MDW8231831.1 tetratricopeptide repeat protein [Roseiflexaceae bacterium]